MSFCSNCGCELSSTTKFCPSCGTAIGNVAVAVKEKEETVAATAISKRDMAFLYTYFLQKDNEYKEYDALSVKITKYGKLRKYISVLFLAVFGIVPATSEVSKELSTVLSALWIILDIGVIVGLKILLSSKLKKSKARMEELNQILSEHYNAYGSCPIGIEYTRPSDIAQIQDVIRSGRAETISEALNIIIDDIHKANMERHAAETEAATKEAAKSAKAAARNTFLNLIK